LRQGLIALAKRFVQVQKEKKLAEEGAKKGDSEGNGEPKLGSTGEMLSSKRS